MGKSIHLVFKTHLDIGFTDLAARVRTQYHDRFIPQAIDTGEHFFAEDPGHPAFVWTTGAWLIWDHLHSQPADKVRRLERAIERGLIAWHGLPFTTHTELMSPALFRAGLSFAQELDRRFGKATIAAKMTDVPGHTLGMVSLLVEAGIKFLHLGVNSASPVPDVPPVFCWRAPDGSEVVVMYQPSYGATQFPPGSDTGLSFAHTNDNMGPQSVPQVAEAWRELRHHHPDADIGASTLDAFAAQLWPLRDSLPIVEEELGDSWIHGSASDPTKTARFLALQRLYDDFVAELTPSRLAFGRGLALVAEHTCGVDIKSYLRDETAWDRPAFEAARRTDPRFAFTEASWAEQRAYLDAAVSMLEGDDRSLVEPAAIPSPIDGQPVAGHRVSIGGWDIAFAPETGDIAALTTPSGDTVSGMDGCLIGYRYESYDAADIERHLHSYLTERPDWALLDHGKPGLAQAKTATSASFKPVLTRLVTDGVRVTAHAQLPAPAHDTLGAPATIELVATPDGDDFLLSLILRNKPANRMPEASFLTLTPQGVAGWRYRKLGLWLAAANVVRQGGGQLQAVSAVSAGRLQIEPLDTPLVGPAGAPFMPFSPEPPDFSGGLRFNIHNNKWGTNFPMWWEGDFIARYRLVHR